MATLRIFDNFGENLEEHRIVSLNAWITENCPSYRKSIAPPFVANLNGKFFDYKNHDLVLENNDLVELIIEPKDPATIVYIAIAVISAAYAYYVASNIPKGYQESAEQGKSLYSSNARANSPQPNGFIREVAGMPTIFPDLICQPRRAFIDNEEYLFLSLAVGRGFYDLSSTNFYIAETQLSYYSGDVQITINEPGTTLTSEANENWYTSKEILDLRLVTATAPRNGDWTADFLADQITSYLDGVATEFPYPLSSVFRITGGTYPGFYRVTAISGSSDEIATVIKLERTDEESTRVNLITQQISRETGRGGYVPPLRLNVFSSNVTPSFSATTESVAGWEGINGGVNWLGPFVVVPPNETARYYQFDIFFRQGLGEIDGDDTVNATVEIEIQYRDFGETEWTTVSSTSFTNNTLDQLGYTIDVDAGSNIRGVVRARRVTFDSSSNLISDIVELRRVKAKLSSPTSYEEITTVGLRLKGTNSLSASAENRINIRGATRKLPTLQEIQDEINGTPYDLSASVTSGPAYYDVNYYSFSKSISLNESGNTDCDFGFNEDGTYMVVAIQNFHHIYELSSPYVIDDAFYLGYYRYTVGYNQSGLQILGDGHYISKFQHTKAPGLNTRFYIDNAFFENDPLSFASGLPTEYIFSGAEADDDLCGHVKRDGTRLWVGNTESQEILQYSFGTAYDASTISYDAVLLDVSGELGDNSLDSDNDIKDLYFADYISGEPSRMYVLSNGNILYQYTMSTPGVITTATFDGSAVDLSEYIIRGFCVEQNEMLILTSASSVSSISKYILTGTRDDRATRSIARFAAYVIYDSMKANALTKVNWDALEDLDTLWESREDYLDCEFVDETTMWEAIKLILSPGYAEPTVKEGIFLPVRSQSGTNYEHIYTPDFMIGDGLKIDHDHYEEQEPDGIDVEYFSILTNSIEVVKCRLPGDLGLIPKRIKAFGIIDADKAWRFGMRERRRLRYKPAIYTFSTELDALNSNYGDAIAIASDVFASQYGEVTNYSAPTVTLNFDPVFGAGTHYAAFKNREGRYSGLYTVTSAGTNQITLSSPSTLDFTPVYDGSMDSTLMCFGTSDQIFVRAIVKNINESGENQVDVTAEEYIAEIYEDDDNNIPE